MTDNPDPIPVDTVHVLCERCGQPVFVAAVPPGATRTTAETERDGQMLILEHEATCKATTQN
jgi:hypothetical protein